MIKKSFKDHQAMWKSSNNYQDVPRLETELQILRWWDQGANKPAKNVLPRGLQSEAAHHRSISCLNFALFRFLHLIFAPWRELSLEPDDAFSSFFDGGFWPGQCFAFPCTPPVERRPLSSSWACRIQKPSSFHVKRRCI